MSAAMIIFKSLFLIHGIEFVVRQILYSPTGLSAAIDLVSLGLAAAKIIGIWPLVVAHR